MTLSIRKETVHRHFRDPDGTPLYVLDLADRINPVVIFTNILLKHNTTPLYTSVDSFQTSCERYFKKYKAQRITTKIIEAFLQAEFSSTYPNLVKNKKKIAKELMAAYDAAMRNGVLPSDEVLFTAKNFLQTLIVESGKLKINQRQSPFYLNIQPTSAWIEFTEAACLYGKYINSTPLLCSYVVTRDHIIIPPLKPLPSKKSEYAMNFFRHLHNRDPLELSGFVEEEKKHDNFEAATRTPQPANTTQFIQVQLNTQKTTSGATPVPPVMSIQVKPSLPNMANAASAPLLFTTIDENEDRLPPSYADVMAEINSTSGAALISQSIFTPEPLSAPTSLPQYQPNPNLHPGSEKKDSLQTEGENTTQDKSCRQKFCAIL